MVRNHKKLNAKVVINDGEISINIPDGLGFKFEFQIHIAFNVAIFFERVLVALLKLVFLGLQRRINLSFGFGIQTAAPHCASPNHQESGRQYQIFQTIHDVPPIHLTETFKRQSL